MTKLTELTEQELADLFGLPFDIARRWLEIARSILEAEESEHPWWIAERERMFGDFESAPSLRRSSVRDLMRLSVEEVKRLKRTGKLYRLHPYLKRRMPTDVQTRLEHLRELLTDESEFEARYPTAYEILFGDSAISGLPLPSFDARVLRNAPVSSVLPGGWHQDWKRSEDGGDAFTLTFERRAEGPAGVDQSFAPLDFGYMRGVLLAILSREEYAERVATELHNEAVREEVGAPSRSSVRFTDLRLATAPELGNPASLEEALLPLLKSLGRPLTTNTVLRWKRNLLRSEEPQVKRSREEDVEIARVSFAAAAILLFLDFDMSHVKAANRIGLAKHVAQLADIVSKLSKSLNANASKLEKLLAYRGQGSPPKPGREFYEALFAYRMGEGLDEVARKAGITPYRSSPSEPGGDDSGGTKHWKSSLAEKLARGARIEEKKYPLATVVFSKRGKSRVKDKARLAYRAYEESLWQGLEEPACWSRVGDRISVKASTDPGQDVIKAYVQLGSCLQRGLDPTHSDFRL